MLKRIFSIIFTACGMCLGLGVSRILINYLYSKTSSMSFYMEYIISGSAIIIFGIIFYLFYSTLDNRSEFKIRQVIPLLVERVPVEELIPGFILLLLAFFLANSLSQIIMQIKALEDMYLNIIISIMIYLGLCYYAWAYGRSIGRAYKDKLSYVLSGELLQKAKKKKNNVAIPKIFDTSVIIDGRIQDILKTGFIEGDIVIPDFVMVELRHISDSADELKRAKGRRGLDILNSIKNERGIQIYNTSNQKEINKIAEVDLKLLKLAEILGGVVLTNDYNLNKVAAVEGIGVLNINELANTLKPVALPGENMRVTPVKEGKTDDQSIAYLEDGTMIVVQGGRHLIGKTIEVTVTSVLQTSAGRMIFVRP